MSANPSSTSELPGPDPVPLKYSLHRTHAYPGSTISLEPSPRDPSLMIALILHTSYNHSFTSNMSAQLSILRALSWLALSVFCVQSIF